MSLINFTAAGFGLMLLMGCMESSQSGFHDLSAGQKAEGFLVVKDIVPSTSVSGAFLVTCAGSGGKTTSETRTKAEIEKNLLCRPSAPSSGQPAEASPDADGASTGTQTGVSALAGSFKLSVRSEVTSATYLKARPGIDISSNKSSYQDGLDYCVVPETLTAKELCRYSQTEYKSVGHNITGCLIVPGYLYSAHFSVTPATVPNCK